MCSVPVRRYSAGVILAAGLLVLLGLGLFVAGILTGVTVLYWACVVACVLAAVLLVAVRRQIGRKPAASTPEPATDDAATGTAGDDAGDEAGDAAPVAATARQESAGTGSAPKTAAAETAVAQPAADLPDPDVEEVEVTDLLLVVDLKDEVLVVDEHPRYHLGDCAWLAGRETIPIPLDEARTDGFTPCATCSPDRTLAERARAAKQAGA